MSDVEVVSAAVDVPVPVPVPSVTVSPPASSVPPSSPGPGSQLLLSSNPSSPQVIPPTLIPSDPDPDPPVTDAKAPNDPDNNDDNASAMEKDSFQSKVPVSTRSRLSNVLRHSLKKNRPAPYSSSSGPPLRKSTTPALPTNISDLQNLILNHVSFFIN